jgi:hypothetical protein
MDNQRVRKSVLAVSLTVVLLSALVIGCGTTSDAPTPEGVSSSEPTATPGEAALSQEPCGDGICDEAEQAEPDLCPQDCPQPEPAAEGLCGDGVCDEDEQAEPDVCPQDCSQLPPAGEEEAVAEPPAEQAPEPEPEEPPQEPEPPSADGIEEYRSPHAGVEWTGALHWTCTIDGNTYYKWNAYVAFAFMVGPDGTLTGQGEGVVYDAHCDVKNSPCACIMEVGIPITAQISGLERHDLFRVSIQPWAEMMHCVTGSKCPGCIPIYQITGCFKAGDKPLDFYVDTKSRARYDFDGPGQSPEAHGEGYVEVDRRSDATNRYYKNLEWYERKAAGEELPGFDVSQ